jgi:hypothetical protein
LTLAPARAGPRAGRSGAGQQAWADLLGELKAELDAGTDPAEPRLAAHVDRWDARLEEFTGGDPGIRAGLQSYWDEHGPEKASQGMVDPEVFAHAQRIRDAHGNAPPAGVRRGGRQGR